MSDRLDRPQLVSDPTADFEVARTIETLNRRIYRHPELYARALDNLGVLATAATVELQNLEVEHGLDQLGTKRLTPDKLLVAYFSKRYDLEANFDDATEEALQSDEHHAELQNTLRQKASIYKRKGVMGSFTEANPDAPNARDEIRRHRLAFFIGRVADWRTAVQDEGAKLPSAV